MSSRLRERLTLGIAVVALFAAVGGPSYAAETVAKIRGDQIARHAITGSKIDTHAVTSSKVGFNAITTSKVKDRTLRLADLAPSARAALRGAAGAKGDKGDAGTPATRMFARVAANGTLLSGSAGAVVTKLAGSGDYEVRWGSDDMSKCAAVATIDDDVVGLAVAHRSASPSAANEVRIITQYSLEATGHPPTDFGFDVAVFC